MRHASIYLQSSLRRAEACLVALAFEHRRRTTFERFHNRTCMSSHLKTLIPCRRYYSPYPEPYCGCEKLYVCEYTMKYFRKPSSLERHLAKLTARQPPGAAFS